MGRMRPMGQMLPRQRRQLRVLTGRWLRLDLAMIFKSRKAARPPTRQLRLRRPSLAFPHNTKNP
jgi:hypothetical protein